jgi:hypothetical protein
MKRTVIAGFVGLMALIALGSCAAVESGPAPPEPAASPTVEEEPAVEPWQGPTDGTWDHGDVGFQEPVEGRISDYRVTLVGLPEFGPLEDGRVVVTGTFTVERFEARGYYDRGTIRDDIKFGFTPGNLSYLRHNETYGMGPRVDCGRKKLAVGGSTTCRVSFAAPVDEIQDFYWWINGDRVAAWPGQVVD